MNVKNEEQDLLEKIEEINLSMEIFERELKSVIKRYDFEKSKLSLKNEIAWLKSEYEKNKDSVENLQQLDQRYDEYEQRIEILKKKVQPYKDEVKTLLEQASVQNETEFYEKDKVTHDIEMLENEKRKLTYQLNLLLDQKIWKQLLKEQWTQKDLERELKSIEIKRTHIETELYSNQQKKADLEAIRLNLENYEEISSSRYNIENKKAILEQDAREWAILKYAKEMLDKTKQLYEKKHLKAIIKQTEFYFKEITDSTYKGIYPPTNELPMQVEDKKGIRYKVNELSTSTIDQLYISLRLAISAKLAKDNQLPFILDDPFVYFDQKRTKNMLNVLKGISKKEQIILFTCKQEIRNELSDMNMLDLSSEM